MADRLRFVAMAFVIAAMAGGCSLLQGNDRTLIAVPPGQMSLWVANTSTRPVELWVNGARVDGIPARQRVEFPADRLPALPWDAEVRFAFGRAILELAVRQGDVSASADGSSQRGVGMRADLSCGRVDIYSGPVLMGPPPDPGEPGDCDP